MGVEPADGALALRRTGTTSFSVRRWLRGGALAAAFSWAANMASTLTNWVRARSRDRGVRVIGDRFVVEHPRRFVVLAMFEIEVSDSDFALRQNLLHVRQTFLRGGDVRVAGVENHEVLKIGDGFLGRRLIVPGPLDE